MMNMYARYFIFFVLTVLFIDAAQRTYKDKKQKCESTFILITTLYNETKTERIQEYITCLDKNVEHPLIEKVHIIYDTSKDSITDGHPILDYLREKNLPIVYIDGRASYGYCFALANEQYSNRKIILTNADIYFNESLAALEHYDLSNKFISLSRFDVNKEGQLVPFRLISADSWVFQTPLRLQNDETIFMGTNECDLLIAYQAKQSGLRVINPCLSIQCCHLHLSGVRNYENKHNKVPAECYRLLCWSTL